MVKGAGDSEQCHWDGKQTHIGGAGGILAVLEKTAAAMTNVASNIIHTTGGSEGPQAIAGRQNDGAYLA